MRGDQLFSNRLSPWQWRCYPLVMRAEAAPEGLHLNFRLTNDWTLQSALRNIETVLYKPHALILRRNRRNQAELGPRHSVLCPIRLLAATYVTLGHAHTYGVHTHINTHKRTPESTYQARTNVHWLLQPQLTPNINNYQIYLNSVIHCACTLHCILYIVD